MTDESTPAIGLTLPEAEAALLRDAYSEADVILEYGGGGSTLLAAGLPGKRVFCVESDPLWADNLREASAALPSVPALHHVDIGRVGAWGRPLTPRQWPRFHLYPTTVWDRPDFVHPDVILIDGLLRPACFATCALRITRPVIVLFDDYVRRRPYHVVEEILRPTLIEGRMAVFEMVPGLLGPSDLTRVLGMFTQVNYAGVA
ncbi:hypothetical protein [Falsirhodobacter sp. 20TX0035]|uniref:hypothetical protein n=1 Tax=Falsirhodobacter sp. 20TX0035 TaxID=3022019 RepID=UPI00232E84F1|nr:hypothetical protein [Falsirhodobacter sp. 20TX0035]MDB6454908.1 hypothetical protein [Falsirhodobacter sp. 20TX0035]